MYGPWRRRGSQAQAQESFPHRLKTMTAAGRFFRLATPRPPDDLVDRGFAPTDSPGDAPDTPAFAGQGQDPPALGRVEPPRLGHEQWG
jgi:hypothetical protein